MNTELLLFVLGELFAKATIVLLAAALIVQVWRRASAAQRHFVWLAAIVIVLLLPLTRLISPWWGVPVRGAMAVETRLVFTPETADSSAAIPVLAARPANAPRPSSPWRLPDWRLTLLGAWVAGGAGLMSYRFLGLWRLRRLERRSMTRADARVEAMAMAVLHEMRIARPVRVRLSAECRVPMTWGFWRPLLVLPAEALAWNDARVAAAIRHEAGHIGRWDYPVRWVAHLACSVYWLHPLVWVAARALRIAQEQATDDLVLRAGTPPEEYAAQLFDSARAVAAHGVFARHAVAMACPSTLENRVLAIVDERRDRRPLTRLDAVVGALGIALTLAIATAAQLQGADPATSSKPEPGPAVAPEKDVRQIEIVARFVEFTPTAEGLAEKYLSPDDVATYSDPQFQVIARAINQMKGVDSLAAPRVTTKPNQSALIEVTREFRYPTEWEKDVVDGWKAKTLDTKNVGVTLGVVPKITSDGSIELRLKPGMVEFLGFTDLDAAKTAGATGSAPEAERLGKKLPKLPAGQRLKPKFSERSIDTTVLLRDGYTVALSGLSPASTATPAVTRRKMIVFVSAKIVDPSGKSAPTKVTAGERAAAIIIPKVQMRQATLKECVEFLRAKSREFSPDGQELNIVAHAPDPDTARITLDLTNIPLIEAARYIAGLANLPLDAQTDALVIGTPPGGTLPPAPAAPGPPGPAMTKARDLVIPSVEFRGVTVEDALDFLNLKAREVDPGKVGLEIALQPGTKSQAKIHLSLTNVPLIEAVHYVAELAGLGLRVDRESLTLTPKGPLPVPTPTLIRNGPDPFSRTALEIVRPLVLPKVDFQDEQLVNVLSVLSEKSRELDPKGQGTTISMRLDSIKAFDFYRRRITLSAENEPMLTVLEKIGRMVGLEMRATPNSLLLDEPKTPAAPTTPAPAGGAGEARNAVPETAVKLGLGPIRSTEAPPDGSLRHFTLVVPIKRLAGQHVNPADLMLKVLFYDLIDGEKVVPTTADVNSHWVTPPADWGGDGTEELAVEYRRSNDGTNRTYLGYVVQIYYKGQLEASTAEPRRLLPPQVPG